MAIWKKKDMPLDATTMIKPLRLIEEKNAGKFGPQDKWECEVNGAASVVFTGYYRKQGAAQNSIDVNDYDNPDALGAALRKATEKPDQVVAVAKFFDSGSNKAKYTYTVGTGITSAPGTRVQQSAPAPAPAPAPQAAPTPKPPAPIQTADDYEADRAERISEQAAKDAQRSVQIIRQAVLKAILPVRPISDKLTLSDIKEEAEYWVDYCMSEYQPRLPRKLHRQLEAVINKHLPKHRDDFKVFLFEKCGYSEMGGPALHLDRLSIKHAETVVANIERFTVEFAKWEVERFSNEPEPAKAE